MQRPDAGVKEFLDIVELYDIGRNLNLEEKMAKQFGCSFNFFSSTNFLK